MSSLTLCDQAYTFCHKKWYKRCYKEKLELLPTDLLKFEESSMRSEDSLFDGTRLSLLERPRSTDTFSLQAVAVTPAPGDQTQAEGWKV